jgi:hypothetical protein
MYPKCVGVECIVQHGTAALVSFDRNRGQQQHCELREQECRSTIDCIGTESNADVVIRNIMSYWYHSNYTKLGSFCYLYE